MNIKIVRVSDPENFTKYEPLLPQISPERRARIAQMRFPRKKTISLVTELLMRNEISKATGIDRAAVEFLYGEHGKPLLKGGGYFFSVSHSGDFVAFAGADSPVGVDIQIVGRADYRVAERFFTKEEYAAIRGASSPEREFFRIWTLKEAYVKMLGTGMAAPFGSFSVLTDEFAGMSRSQDLGEYILSVFVQNKEGITENFAGNCTGLTD